MFEEDHDDWDILGTKTSFNDEQDLVAVSADCLNYFEDDEDSPEPEQVEELIARSEYLFDHA